MWKIRYVVMMLVLNSAITSAIVQHTTHDETRLMLKEVTKDRPLGIYVYVYNEEKDAWDRAREDTLKTATCDRLKYFVD